MKAGDTFYNRNPTSPPRLWVVGSDPDDAGTVAIFPIVPKGPRIETTCIIPIGHHPEVRGTDHAVDYDGGRRLSREAQEVLSARGYFDAREAFDPALTRRIQNGALVSDFASGAIQALVARSLPDLN